MTEAKLISAFLLGLVSSVHCFGMCGGISVAMGMSVPDGRYQKLSRLFAHSIGRILCYAILGLLVGSISQVFVLVFQPLAGYLRIFSGVMLVAMGLYIAQWWMGLAALEKAGQGIWKKIQPQISTFQPISRLRNAFMLGLCWGMLPCGLVYSVLAWTASSSSAVNAAVLMFVFGLGTLPAMVTSGYAGSQLKKFLQKLGLRILFALLLCLMGIWTIIQASSHH